MHAIKNFLLLLYWFPVKYLFWLLPVPLAYRVLALGSYLLSSLSPGQRSQQLHDELRQVAPCADEQYCRQAVRRAFWSLLCCEYEMLLYPRMTANNIGQFVNYKGLENLDAVLLEGKGAMLLFAHFGANQMVMPAIGYRGYRMSQLSAPATVWEEKLQDRIFLAMEKFGMRKRWQHEQSLPVSHINIFGSLKGAFRCLRENGVLGVAIDGGGGAERVIVDFLNGQAGFSIGAFEIARRTGCAVLPVFMERDLRTGRNEFHVEHAFHVVQSGESTKDKKHFVQSFARKLEHYVQRSPWLYLNFLVLRRRMAAHGDAPFFLGNKGSVDENRPA